MRNVDSKCDGLQLNPLERKGNYNVTSNNMKLMDGLLHFVQEGGAWAGLQPAKSLLSVSNVTAQLVYQSAYCCKWSVALRFLPRDAYT